MTHTEEKTFTCENCLKKFGCDHVVKTHILTHTWEKSFTCENCVKKNSQVYNIKRHILTNTEEIRTEQMVSPHLGLNN